MCSHFIELCLFGAHARGGARSKLCLWSLAENRKAKTHAPLLTAKLNGFLTFTDGEYTCEMYVMHLGKQHISQNSVSLSAAHAAFLTERLTGRAAFVTWSIRGCKMQVKALFIRKKHSSPNIVDCRRVDSPAWWVMVSVQNPQRSRKQDSSATQRTQGRTRENPRRTGTGNNTGKLQQRSDNPRQKTRRYIGWLMEYSWRWWDNQVISGNAHMKQSVHTHKMRENRGLSNRDSTPPPRNASWRSQTNLPADCNHR